MKLIEAKELNNEVKIAVVVSRFNTEVTDLLQQETLERLKELEINPDNITVVHVPGAIEIPIVTQRLVATEQFKAVIALGCVIRGETSHHECVCGQASLGCQRIALDSGVPVIFGVLTTENLEQALDRVNGKKGYKGRDAADAALEMISVLEQV